MISKAALLEYLIRSEHYLGDPHPTEDEVRRVVDYILDSEKLETGSPYIFPHDFTYDFMDGWVVLHLAVRYHGKDYAVTQRAPWAELRQGKSANPLIYRKESMIGYVQRAIKRENA